MAPTMIRGGIRELIVATGRFGARVWADTAPLNATMPYVTIDDALSVSPALSGDGSTIALVRMGQVNLWERLRDEDPANAAALFIALDGVKVSFDGVITRLSVDDSQRLVDDDNNNVHRALTVTLRHVPAAY